MIVEGATTAPNSEAMAVTVAQPESQIPPHTDNDHVIMKLTLSEQWISTLPWFSHQPIVC
jgi:hypothetical protein